MYKKFFSLRERPFKLVPDPEYYYLSRSHEEAMAHLTYTISQGDGFVEITGEVGTGKTMLCRVFLENLDDQTEAAYIFNPKLGPSQLLKAINDEFNIETDSDDTKAQIDALNRYLMQKKVEGKRVIVLIDEAQNLARNVMEQLRLLSNLETSKFKLLQIILVGQPELGEMLDSYELRQLRQRITLNCHIAPLPFKEVREYIDHRIHVAAGGGLVEFSRDAYRQIYKYSTGIPRLINIVCDRSLLTAYGLNQKKITGGVAQAAIRELSGRGELTRFRLGGVAKGLAAVGVAAIVAFLIFLLFHQGSLNPIKLLQPINEQNQQETRPDPSALEAAIHPADKTAQLETLPSQITAVGTGTDLLAYLEDMDVRSARHLAIDFIAELWGLEAGIPAELDEVADNFEFFKHAGDWVGLSVVRANFDLGFIKRMNLPTIVEMKLPGKQVPGFLTIRKVTDENITLGRVRGNRLITVPSEVLKEQSTGTVYIPWMNFLGHKGPIPNQEPHESVIMLKMYLKEIGFPRVGVSPFYDENTEQAVKQIQGKYGLVADGIVGPLTKVALFNEYAALNVPHIVSESDDSQGKDLAD